MFNQQKRTPSKSPLHKYSIIILTMLLVLVLSACGATKTSDKKDAAPTQTKPQITSVSWAGSGLTSGANATLNALASIINTEEKKLKVAILTTEGAVAGVRLLRDKQADVANLSNITAYQGAKNISPYQNEKPFDGLFLFTLYSYENVLVADASKNIKELKDLVGKRVSVGQPGAGSTKVIEDMLKAGNMFDKIDKVYLAYTEGAAAMKEGRISAMTAAITAGDASSAYLQEMLQSIKLVIVRTPDETLKATQDASPYMGISLIPAGTLPGFNEAVKGLAGANVEYASKDVSEETAYLIVKTIYENLDKVSKLTSTGKWQKIDNALSAAHPDIPVHPGAAKYYKEKGVWDDRLKIGTLK